MKELIALCYQSRKQHVSLQKFSVDISFDCDIAEWLLLTSDSLVFSEGIQANAMDLIHYMLPVQIFLPSHPLVLKRGIFYFSLDSSPSLVNVSHTLFWWSQFWLLDF